MLFIFYAKVANLQNRYKDDSVVIGDLSARSKKMEQFLEQDPENVNLFCECFELFLQLGDFDKAAKLVEKTLQILPEESSVVFCQSKLYLAQGAFDKALESTLNLIEKGVMNPGVLYNQVWSQLNLAMYESVVENIESHLEFTQQYPPLLLVKVRALHHLQQFQLAIEAVESYIELDLTNDEAFGLNAILHLDIAEYESAKLQANKALAINPYNHDALTTLSSLALNHQEPDEVLKLLSIKPELTSKSGRMMLNLGQAFMLKMEFDKAESALKDAASLMSSHIGTWHALAWVEIVLGKIDDAKRCFERAMELDRNFSESHGGLAVIAIFQNELTLAEKLTKTSLKLDPLCTSGRYAESLLLEKHGNAELAKSKVTELITQAKGVDGEPITQLIEKAGKRLNVLPDSNNTFH